jgi:acyl-CoA thioesterase FadM
MVPVVLRAKMSADRGLVSRLHRRVHLDYIDWNWHMNQSRYAEVMELGRAHWMVQSGSWEAWRAQRANPVVANQTLVYRRELKPLQRFEVDTRAIAVEGRMLHLQSFMLVGDKVHASSDVRVLFVGPDGVVPADQVASMCKDRLHAALPVENWRVVS